MQSPFRDIGGGRWCSLAQWSSRFRSFPSRSTIAIPSDRALVIAPSAQLRCRCFQVGNLLTFVQVYCAHHSQFTPHGHGQLIHSFGYDGEYYFGALPGVCWFFEGGGTYPASQLIEFSYDTGQLIASALSYRENRSGSILCHFGLRLILLATEADSSTAG